MPVTDFGEDTHGKFAVLKGTEIEAVDGFVFTVEQEFDPDLGCEWGYQVCLKRNDAGEKELFHNILKLRGVDPNSVNLIIPPRQSISVYLNPRGEVTGSSLQEPALGGLEPLEPGEGILKLVRASAEKRLLFLPHAIRQMSRSEKMITTSDVRRVIEIGIVIEDYVEDLRGHSCLILGFGDGDRPIHVVCSPKPEFVAIITAYLPDPKQWSNDFKVRLKR